MGHRAIFSTSSSWYLNCGFNPGCRFVLLGGLPSVLQAGLAHAYSLCACVHVGHPIAGFALFVSIARSLPLVLALAVVFIAPATSPGRPCTAPTPCTVLDRR
jgi:hypothetical protein